MASNPIQFRTIIVPLANVPKALKPYHFHGVELDYRDNPEWAPGSCPFCLKDSHFFVKVEDGRFKCQRCDAEGNTYTFLEMLFQRSLELTKDSDLAPLAKDRKVSVASLRAFEVVKSCTTGEFILPGYNTKKVLTNLYRCIPRQDETGKYRWQIISTPECKVTPYGLKELWSQPSKPTIFVNEGLWDGCATYDALINTTNSPGGVTTRSKSPSAAKGTSTPSTTKSQYSPNYSNTGILCAPAAGNFSSEWFLYCEDKDTLLLFDNDHPKLYPADHEKAGELIVQRGKPVCPGWDGMQRIIKLAATSSRKPRSLKTIQWHPDESYNHELPDGYDMRDHLTAHAAYVAGDNHQQPAPAGMVPPGLAGVLLMMVDAVISSSPTKEAAKSSAKPIERTTFDELCDDYSKVYHMTQNIRDTLSIMLAVILSTESESINHLWLRVIGPPGSLKSTLAEAVSCAREWVNPKSVITGFHSGFLDPSGNGESASLIPVFNNKTVVMKDADTLSNSPVRDQILRELRDLYDGTSRSAYRNKTGDEFENIRMSFILCGTDELRSLNRTFLGERFLDCEIVNRGEDTSLYLKRAINNTYESLLAGFSPANSQEASANGNPLETSPDFIKAVTYGFIKFLKENYKSFRPPHMDEKTKEHLEGMGQLVARIRARLKDDKDANYKPRTEFGTRLGSQFTKLAFFVALVLQRDHIDEEVIRIVLKVVRDTCVSFQYDIVEQIALSMNAAAISQNPLGGGVELNRIVSTIASTETTVRRMMSAMLEFKVLQRRAVANNSGQRGRDRHVWELTPDMLKLWNDVFNSHPTLPVKSSKDQPTSRTHTSRGAPKPKPRPTSSEVSPPTIPRPKAKH